MVTRTGCEILTLRKEEKVFLDYSIINHKTRCAKALLINKQIKG